jgi:hypothetical protein
MWRRAGVITALAALCWALAGGGVAVASYGTEPGAGAPATGGVWGQSEAIPGLAGLSTGGSAAVDAVSCGSAGNCAAGGSFTDAAGQHQAFVVSQQNGTWGNAAEVPGTAALNAGGYAQVLAVSCPSAGNCAAGGSVDETAGQPEPFVVSEQGGIWGAAQLVPGIAALNAGGDAQVLSLSCPTAGNCAAGGAYLDSSGFFQAFVVSEQNGQWGTALEVPGMATTLNAYNSDIGSVSCPSDSDCVAGGSYQVAGVGIAQAFVVTEANGIWGNALEVPGTAALNLGGATIESVSCASAGNCSAGGLYTDGLSHGQAFVVSQVNGVWGTAEQVPGTAALNAGGQASVPSVSCASPGDCTAGGWYTDSSGSQQAFAVNQVNGVWDTAEQVPGTAALDGGQGEIRSVSCASAGNCSAAGEYQEEGSEIPQAFVVSQVDGTWGTAQEVPGSAAADAGGSVDATHIFVSCPLPGNCTTGGSYGSGQPFVVSELNPGAAASETAITSTTPHPVVGQPVAVAVAVSATPPGSGHPTGAVTVSAGTRSCHAQLVASGSVSAGSCTITESMPGQYPLTVSYPGSSVFGASASLPGTLDVTKAGSNTTLRLSAATAIYGHERAVRLTVHVVPRYSGTPTGTVIVTTGNTVLCTITLSARSAGRGSCKLASKTRLRPDRYLLTARYHGSADFRGSSSQRVRLNVTRRN